MSEKRNNGISRRDFGKSTAIGATALASFSIVKNVHAQDDPLKIGLIGCGGRGTGAAQNAIQASSNVEIVAVGDVFEDRVDNCVRRLRENENIKQNVANLTDDAIYKGLDAYKKVLEHELDYVILATPPGFRPEHFEAVVDRQLNCFCEKPVATDPFGIRRFMKAAKKSEELKLHITTGNQRRHQKEYIETVEKIQNGVLGDIVSCRAYWCGGLPFARERQDDWSDLEFQLRNWYNFCWICGDNIVEQHIHNLDVINWVMQDHPVSVIASGGRSWKPRIEKYGNIWDNFSCDYEYPNGVHMYSFSRHLNGSYNEVSELVTGTNQDFHNGVSNCRDMGEGGMNPYVAEHKALQDSIRGDGPYWNQAVQVCEATLTAMMGRIAAYTGKKITWDEAYNMDLRLAPETSDMSFEAEMEPRPIPQTPMP